MYLYILKSNKDLNHYVGISANPHKRLKDHNSGRCFSTRSRRPFQLIYQEEWPDLKTAREREKFLKSYEGCGEKLSIIDQLEWGVAKRQGNGFWSRDRRFESFRPSHKKIPNFPFGIFLVWY